MLQTFSNKFTLNYRKYSTPIQPSSDNNSGNSNSNNNNLVIDMINMKKYKIAKPKKRKPGFSLEQGDLEQKALSDVLIAQKKIKENKEKQEHESKMLKKQYPLRFCVIHRIFYDTEEQYTTHTLRNHPQIAVEEDLAQFSCEHCGDAFIRYGNYRAHFEECIREKQYLKTSNKLSARQKYLVKQGQQIRRNQF
ncbi:hypothetical protein ABPG72_016366 [Tetrahymena utriculariae]